MTRIFSALLEAMLRVAFIPLIVAGVLVFSGEMQTVSTGAIQLIEVLNQFSN